MRVGVGELAQFGGGVGGDPTRTGVTAVFQAHITVVLGPQTVLHHFKLQLTNSAQQHGATHFGFEHLNRAFFAQLLEAGLQLLGAQWVLQNHGHEQLGCEKRQAGELQGCAIGDGVAQLHAAMRGEADDVAGKRFVHRFAALAQEGDHRGGAQLFGAALHLEFHAGFVLTRGNAHKGDAVAVVGVHVGLHLEHHPRKTSVFRLHGFVHRLLVDHQMAGAWAR